MCLYLDLWVFLCLGKKKVKGQGDLMSLVTKKVKMLVVKKLKIDLEFLYLANQFLKPNHSLLLYVNLDLYHNLFKGQVLLKKKQMSCSMIGDTRVVLYNSQQTFGSVRDLALCQDCYTPPTHTQIENACNEP